MAIQYSFVTKWQIEAPVELVWDAIVDSTQWPQWWKGVVAVNEMHAGDSQGIGSIRHYVWKSVLPYQLRFNIELTAKQDYHLLTGRAFGELEGMGEWTFSEHKNLTIVQYTWNVHTTKWWMNYFAFLLKPAFHFNHDMIMKWGAIGLSKKLRAKLISHT
jgi:hypothetical protein